MNEKISNKSRAILILAIIGIALGVWYWFSYRPSKIRERCMAEAEFNPVAMSEAKDRREWQKFVEQEYTVCTHRFGIK